MELMQNGLNDEKDLYTYIKELEIMEGITDMKAEDIGEVVDLPKKSGWNM